MATTVAIDWSGARNPRGKIWLALAHDGELAELKVWKIGGSSPAPQLDVVVEPDEWVRSVRATNSGELSSTELAYRDFWAEFLADFHERYPGWSRAKVPSNKSFMNFPSGKSQVHYSVNFCRPNSRPRFRFELYIDATDADEVANRFALLREQQAVIEQAFGKSLEWEPLDVKRASRIASYYPEEVDVHMRGK